MAEYLNLVIVIQNPLLPRRTCDQLKNAMVKRMMEFDKQGESDDDSDW
jgi:hypothetical protein